VVVAQLFDNTSFFAGTDVRELIPSRRKKGGSRYDEDVTDIFCKPIFLCMNREDCTNCSLSSQLNN
jgi:hypothetical protein